MTTIGMGKRAGVALSWDCGNGRKVHQRDLLRARTARLVPVELPEPEEKPWLWECPEDCDCQWCTAERVAFDRRPLGVFGAPPERLPDCDLPDCPMCFAARKWLPEKDARTFGLWRQDRLEGGDEQRQDER